MTPPRRHKHSIIVPVFGEIPLDPKVAYRELRMKDAPLWAQFSKYAMCGMLSLVVFAIIVAGFEIWAPEYVSDELPIAVRQDHLRVMYFWAFIPTNLVAYFSNRMFVFTPGRHRFGKEIGIFMLVSAMSFLGGELGKVWMVNQGMPNLAASGAFVFSSAMVNFVARKFLVFSR